MRQHDPNPVALNEAFPRAKYVWLLRDGRHTVSSFHARPGSTGRRLSWLISPFELHWIWSSRRRAWGGRKSSAARCPLLD